MVSHAPLFRTKTPGNVNAFNEIFVEFASFDLIDLDGFSEMYMYFPEREPFDLNFMMCGYEKVQIIPAMGFNYYYIPSFALMGALYIMTFRLARRFIRVK